MKKIPYLLFALFLAACGNSGTKSTVEGEIGQMKTGEIYFIRSGDQQDIDTVKVKDEHFTYEAEVKEPTIYMVNFGPEEQPGFLVLEPGKTTLKYTMGQAGSLEVKGGAEQGVYNDFLAECRPLFRQMDSLGQLAMNYADSSSLMQSLQESFYKLDTELKDKQAKFISAHKENAVTAFIAINYLQEKGNMAFAEAEEMYKGLGDKARNSYYGKKMQELVGKLKGTSLGQPAPDFTLNDPGGKPVSLSSFKGRVTLVDFWASWCGPCRAENPHVVEAYQAFHGKGLEILGVSLDEDAEQWKKAIEKDGLTWTHVSDLKGWSSSAAALYGVQSIPANFLLDKEGRIIARDLRGDALSAKLRELFP